MQKSTRLIKNGAGRTGKLVYQSGVILIFSAENFLKP